MPSSRGTKRKERNVLRRERPDVRGRISKEPDSFPSINPTSSLCIGYTGARLLRTLTALGIIDIGKSACRKRSPRLTPLSCTTHGQADVNRNPCLRQSCAPQLESNSVAFP